MDWLQRERVADMYEVLDGADALVVCTEWNEFRSPDFQQLASRMKAKVVFDGRNLYKRSHMEELGFTYYSVGRQPVRPHAHKGAAARSG